MSSLQSRLDAVADNFSRMQTRDGSKFAIAAPTLIRAGRLREAVLAMHGTFKNEMSLDRLTIASAITAQIFELAMTERDSFPELLRDLWSVPADFMFDYMLKDDLDPLLLRMVKSGSLTQQSHVDWLVRAGAGGSFGDEMGRHLVRLQLYASRQAHDEVHWKRRANLGGHKGNALRTYLEACDRALFPGELAAVRGRWSRQVLAELLYQTVLPAAPAQAEVIRRGANAGGWNTVGAVFRKCAGGAFGVHVPERIIRWCLHFAIARPQEDGVVFSLVANIKGVPRTARRGVIAAIAEFAHLWSQRLQDEIILEVISAAHQEALDLLNARRIAPSAKGLLTIERAIEKANGPFGGQQARELLVRATQYWSAIYLEREMARQRPSTPSAACSESAGL